MAYTRIITIISLIFVTHMHQTHGYAAGAPSSACESMTPAHTDRNSRITPQDMESNTYSLISSSSVYSSNQDITVEIVGNVSGFMLQARTVETNSVVGTFMRTPDGAQLMECSNADDTVTHTNQQVKSGLEFVWRAPSTSVGTVEFVSTLAESKDVFWVGVKSTNLAFSSNTRGEDITPVPSQEGNGIDNRYVDPTDDAEEGESHNTENESEDEHGDNLTTASTNESQPEGNITDIQEEDTSNNGENDVHSVTAMDSNRSLVSDVSPISGEGDAGKEELLTFTVPNQGRNGAKATRKTGITSAGSKSLALRVESSTLVEVIIAVTVGVVLTLN